MVKKQKRKTIAVKKKQWVKILAPDNKELGESHVEDPKTLVGRKITVNLMSYLGGPKNRKYNVTFLINECDGSTAKTRICSFETQPSSLKMVVKKGSGRVDHRLIVKTKNKETLIIKPLITTKDNVSALMRSKMRKVFDDIVKKEISKLSTDEAFNDIIFQKIHKSLKKEISKLYPVKVINIKRMDLILNKKDVSEKKVKLEEPIVVVEENEGN